MNETTPLGNLGYNGTSKGELVMSRNSNEHPKVPDPQVGPMAEWRRFSAEKKLGIVEEADACTEQAEIGSFEKPRATWSMSVSIGGSLIRPSF